MMRVYREIDKCGLTANGCNYLATGYCDSGADPRTLVNIIDKVAVTNDACIHNARIVNIEGAVNQ